MERKEPEGTPHIVLLGDSVFDNGAYTEGAPDVASHLRSIVPEPWQVTLCAVDGDTTLELPSRLSRVPENATHLAVSIGGNDALMHADILNLPVTSTAQALRIFGGRVAQFESCYRAAVQRVLALRRRTLLCSVYNGNLDLKEAEEARVALTMFNDVIFRVAIEHGLPLVDLRFVCSGPEDYSNPIEPSGVGGRKIAEAIARAFGALPKETGTHVTTWRREVPGGRPRGA